MQQRPPQSVDADNPARSRAGPPIAPTDAQSGEPSLPRPEDLPTIRIGEPVAQLDGALPTHIGEPSRAAEMASAARAAQARARQDLGVIATDLAQIAAALHDHTRQLEHAVEGEFAGDPGDPRVRLLAETLAVVRRADLRLAQIGAALSRLRDAVDASQASVGALEMERERLSLLYQAAQELNSALDLDDILGGVLARLIEVVRAERGLLMLWDASASVLRFTVARGADGQPLNLNAFSISRGVVARVWVEQRPLLTTDAQADERLRANESVVA